ncbi:YhgE/Pip domain-containing protein [Salinicoccus sp. YB14-2]|uniref:YhgE/Pip domain-containing protein n=1 Tax=Salinicoccus sp. YB14-2 TaxID=1572701 RepID=UPI00068FDE24|nr:YhgE/Pip domain-containing protein [Salinicoccus sp. YB14-2]
MLQDFKFIFKKPLLLVSLAVIALFPVIYAVTFLGAMWDPYDQTGDMQFHIVNEDAGNEDIELGKEIEAELKDNDQLDWQFSTLEKAEEAIKSGESYGYLEIPADASDNAMTFLSESPENVNLKLKTNPGFNFIGSIMSEQVGSVLVETVQKEITETYTKTLISELGSLSDQSDEAQDAIAELKNGAVALDDGLGQLEDSSAQLIEVADSLESGAAQVSEGAGTLYNGEQQFTGQISQLAPMLGNYAQPVQGAQSELENGAGELNEASTQLAGGASELNSGIVQMNGGISELKAGSSEMAEALTEVDTRFNEQLAEIEEQNIVFSDEGAEAIASPVNLDIESMVDTQNYAQSFAPLIIAVSLYIGAITFNVVYPMNKIFENKKNVFSQWLSRGLLFLSHSVIITTLLYAAIVWVMQIEIASHWRVYFAMLVWSLVSISIIGLLVMIFGNFGKFLGIVLLIVQLSSSGGTFPIETANNFYQTLYEFLPMAFVVSGFKDAIFGQAFDMEFSTIMYTLLATAAGAYLLILLVLWLKDKFPKYEEKANRMSKFEN